MVSHIQAYTLSTLQHLEKESGTLFTQLGLLNPKRPVLGGGGFVKPPQDTPPLRMEMHALCSGKETQTARLCTGLRQRQAKGRLTDTYISSRGGAQTLYVHETQRGADSQRGADMGAGGTSLLFFRVCHHSHPA